MTAEKQKYMANSPIIFNIEKSLMLDDGLTNIHLNDSNGNSIKEILLSNIESNSSPQFIALPGDYTAIATLEINGAERIESQPFYFRIIKNLIEKDEFPLRCYGMLASSDKELLKLFFHSEMKNLLLNY